MDSFNKPNQYSNIIPNQTPQYINNINQTSPQEQAHSYTYNHKQNFGKQNLIYKKNKISKANSFSSITPIKRAYTYNIDNDDNLNQTSITHNISAFETNSSTPIYPFHKTNTCDNIYYSQTEDIQTTILNVEELLLFESQYNEILKCLQKGLFCYDECFEWWNFYFTSSLCYKLSEYFLNNKPFQSVIQRSINLELLSIILCYDISFNECNFNELLSFLQQLIKTHHYNLLLLSKYLLSKIITPKNTNQWITKMDNMIHSNTVYNLTQQSNVDIIKQIQMNCDNITELQRIIITHYANTYLIENIIMLFKRITTLTPYEINIFFREKVIRVLNRNGSILASSANQTQKDYLFKNIIKIPFLNNESLKQYTLVLDLDETLVHFTDDPNDANKGVLHFRPGLFEFLDKVSEYYELVVFTAATKEYADPILEAIEQNKIIFEYKLYREHTTIIGDDFVKDISKLGRDLSKVIIVDNMPQCFRLQKENGVFIRPFWGKDNEDCALIDLVPILISIAKEGLDVRKGLLHYKDEIINKVTSNFYRRNFIK